MRELRVGWREFTSRSRVWVIVVAFCFLNAGITASLTVLGPAVADTTGIGRTGWARPSPRARSARSPAAYCR